MTTLKDLFNNNISESNSTSKLLTNSTSKLLTNSMNKVESISIEMEKILRRGGPLESALKQTNADLSYLSDMRDALAKLVDAYQELNMSANRPQS